MTDTLAGTHPPEISVLDAYSQVVVSVAEQLTPRVAAVQVSRRRGDGGVAAGAGSAVVFTNDGFLLTNAHVVGRAEAGQAAFADGTTAPFRVVGSDPLSDLAVVRADGRRAYLGLAGTPAPLPPPLASRLSQKTGMRIEQVVSGGPAAQAGLRPDDSW